jgi:hypothetical protein
VAPQTAEGANKAEAAVRRAKTVAAAGLEAKMVAAAGLEASSSFGPEGPRATPWPWPQLARCQPLPLSKFRTTNQEFGSRRRPRTSHLYAAATSSGWKAGTLLNV